MSKLSFRARALDASKPMPIFLAEELPDLPEYSAINRAVPQMPSGMEKEEECEHHLQRAICTGLIIPTPEVYEVSDLHFYERCYPPDYKMPKQHIHMQPLWQEQETPEYDIDSEDERWLKQQRHPDLTELKFEQMMDKLERSSGQTVVTLKEAKLLLERHDDLVIAVYDYWLNKRLKTQHPLILSVKTEHRPGQSSNNPYLAFRRRTEKMQTRKNRKNDESSYEKMLKLRRDLGRAVTLLALVARREDTKRDLVRLTALLAERRFAAGEFAHHLTTDAPTPTRPSVSSVHVTAVRREYAAPYPARDLPAPLDQPRQREKRPYKRRKHRHREPGAAQGLRESGVYTSSEEESTGREAAPDDGPFAFRRKPGCFYEMPTSTLCGDPVDPETDTNVHFKHEMDERYRFSLTSLRGAGCAGLARRRAGRGGRALLDRRDCALRHLFSRLPFKHDTRTDTLLMELETKLHRTPKTVTQDYHASGKYPWRHAFRKHLARNPHLWIDRDTKTPVDEFKTDLKIPEDLKTDLKIVKDKVEDSEIKSDISVSARTIESVVKDNLRRVVRKRTWSGSSDSSYDSEESLYPVEKEFEKFINEVDKTWLHFRPKTPPPPLPEEEKPTEDMFPLAADTPITVEVRTGSPSGVLDTFTTSEFSLSQLYPDMASPDNEIDLSGDDILSDNLGLTEAQVESMLSDTDLKALADVDLTKDEKGKLPDLLEELVKDVDTKDSFLLHGQGSEGRANSGQRKKKAEAFGSTVVQISGMDKEPIYIEREVQELPKKIETPKKKVEKKVVPAPVPTSKIIVEEVNEVPHIKIEKRKKEKEDTIEEVQLGHGVQLKTVHTVNSPVKKHIITSHRRPSDVTLVTSQGQSPAEQPHLVTVAVSDSLKVRLQNHLSVSQAAAMGVVSGVGTVGTVGAVGANGPFPTPLAVAVPIHHHAGGAGSGGRRAPVLSMGVRPLVPPVVLQHQLAPGKLKVVHAAHLTHNQRSQLLAHSRATGINQLPAVVSLAPLGDAKTSNTALLKAGPGSVAQYFEIKGGQLGKGPHLVNVLRHPPPRTVKGNVAFDGTIKGNVVPRQKVSLSLDGRQLAVRTAVPVRHQIQIKNRTVQVAPHQPSTSITLAQTKTSIPSSVVANLIHKNVQLPKGGPKIAISGPGGQLLANVQARLIAQPRPQPVAEIVESSPAAASSSGAEPEPSGAHAAGDTLPMEVT